MKIGLFCNEYPPRQHGGIGVFTRDYARGLFDAGHEPTVVEFGPDALTRKEDGIRIVTLPSPPRLRGITDLRLRFRLWRWVRAQEKKGLLDVFELPEFDGMMPFPIRCCATVVRLHLSRSVVRRDLGGSISLKMALFENLTLRFNPNWIGVSRYILERSQDVFDLHPRRSKVVHNPVADPSLSERVPLAQESSAGLRPYILFVGYVGERKGALVLTEAVKLLLPAFPYLNLVFVGKEDDFNGEPVSKCLHGILGDSFADHLHFKGPLPHNEVLEWMRSASVVCLPSRCESFGLVPVEAMMLGRPTVFSNCGPGPEIVDHEVTGLLCNPHSAQDLAAKIERFLANPSWSETVGTRAQTVAVEKFSITRCVEGSLRFYEQVIADTRKGILSK